MTPKPKKPKVLFLTFLPPPLHGVSYLSSLMLDESRITNKYDLTVKKINPNQTLESIGRFGFGKLFHAILVMLKILSQRMRKRFDFCYFSISAGGFALVRDMLIIALLLRGLPVIVHIQGRDYFKVKGKRIMPALLRAGLKNKTIIQFSPLLTDDIDWIGVQYNARFFLPNGIPDTQPCLPKPAKKNRTIFLYFSNISKAKGVFVFLNALDELRLKGLKFEVLMAGECRDVSSAELERLIADKGLEGMVQYLGPIHDEEEKKRFLSRGSALVFPTLIEGFGIVAIEAYRSGLPVVASMEGCLPEIIENGKTGLLFPTGDSGALALQLAYLINDPAACSRMGDAARKRFLENYEWGSFVDKLLDVFEVAAGNRKEVA